MAKAALQVLTETMFYVLMALRSGPMCGIDAADYIERRTGGRLSIGPATLYTILHKFEQEKWIREIQVEGRKRTYCLTAAGESAYEKEWKRLRLCLEDAAEAEEERRNHHG